MVSDGYRQFAFFKSVQAVFADAGAVQFLFRYQLENFPGEGLKGAPAPAINTVLRAQFSAMIRFITYGTQCGIDAG